MVKYILGIGADPGDDHAISAAMDKGDDIRNLLLRKFSEKYPNGKGNVGSALLHESIQKNDLQTTTWLIKNKMGIHGWMPCKGFRHNPFQPSICSEPHQQLPLVTAIESDTSDSFDLTQLLLNNGAGVDDIARRTTGGRITETPLLVAISKYSLKTVRFLVERGANINAPYFAGIDRTPLQRAIEVGDIGIVKYLLERGAEVNTPAYLCNGVTALQAAVGRGCMETVDLLIAHNVDVNAPPAVLDGRTALQLAATEGMIGIIYILLQLGAHIDADRATFGGRTALESAAENGRLDTVALLLEAGAQIDGPGMIQFENAVSFADKNGHLAVADLLRGYRNSRFPDGQLSE